MQVETLALLIALHFVDKSTFETVSIEFYCYKLISSLLVTDLSNWMNRALISKCQVLLQRLSSVYIAYCLRSANFVADWAAREHRKKSIPTNWLLDPPVAL